ncbi:MAG: alpha/beta hydrolase, partial [Bacteroidota bacterium]
EQTHQLDVYTPEGDSEGTRPLVILAHGGGFTGGDRLGMESLADYLARSGYVVASISYRLIDVEPTPEIMLQGVWDAVLDMKAAVRFFRADASNGNGYGIDANKIFVGGYSAGAFMALHLAYMNAEAEFEAAGGTNFVQYVADNGGIEGNSGSPGVSSEVRGVINLAGALKFADFVDAGEAPLVSAHGTADDVVPIGEGDADNSGVITQGSGLIHPVATQVGVENELISVEDGGHDVLGECDECPSQIRSFIFRQF